MSGGSPNQNIVKREEWETVWEEKKDVEHVYSNAGRVLKNLSLVTSLKGKKILEIGAGTGRDSFAMIRVGATIYQLDYAENSLRILQSIAAEQKVEVEIIGGDAFNLPFRDECFDIVFHQGLLEHFHKTQADALLRENIRVIKPGGYLLVDVPQRVHPYALTKFFLIAVGKWFVEWERSFSVPELKKLFRMQGLEPVHCYGEWMYPSFYYRVLREVGKKVGIQLPLYPRPFPRLTDIRLKIRSVLHKTIMPRYTGMDIGVIGKKKA
ncbi:MAG: class I SAM-dependent methyltransferase [bacterium]